MSTLKVTNIKNASSSSNNIVLNSNGTVSFPNNENVIQVVSTFKDSPSIYYNINQGNATPIFIDRSITMSGSSNKVLVIANVSVGMDSNHGTMPTLTRGGGNIRIGNTATGGSRQRVSVSGTTPDNNVAQAFTMVFLDTPGAGTHTYGVKSYHTDNGNRHIYVNRGDTNSNDIYYGNSACTLTLMECTN